MKLPTNLAGIARLILSPNNNCKSIVILTGAGVSVASGIPDFRSPGGMYATLRPELITATPEERRLMRSDPTYVVEKEMFTRNQFPYLEVRRPFILGTRDRRWKATLAHRFAELLHVKTGKLTRVYTQNIDGLYGQCDEIPSEKIVSVHGTIGKASCEACGFEADYDQFCHEVKHSIKDIYNTGDEDAPSASKNINCRSCGKPAVKPTTVLFGGAMPEEFFERVTEDLPSVDLLIVAGTSLVVAPANAIVFSVPEKAIRLIVNNEEVGHSLGIDYSETAKRDYFAKGMCDEVFLDLMCELGWLSDLSEIVDELPEASRLLVNDRLAKSS
mmetsp:Transcript_10987/g.13627  ORF Transcript_10987/g.13627 Transcript_10987/m.13627 type:complete len:329 (+) Transcript_10987:85-1071(+)|eukprot:CAMPEP_0172506828 /NCGR_PEP_ID=MMETSP1066-20121228/198678_1 /TAXON_ID=671091 /ORGANISM="Coscinodiscus wailesii, Strain CCMP2513" /LENGTH=328 /DNA_ID=CAMNT_0013284057 /DNA_START=67 /DNA_END=1053 /DNA_ORIENTATION=+